MPGSPRGVPTSLPVCATAFRNGAALDKLRFYKIYTMKNTCPCWPLCIAAWVANICRRFGIVPVRGPMFTRLLHDKKRLWLKVVPRAILCGLLLCKYLPLFALVGELLCRAVVAFHGTGPTSQAAVSTSLAQSAEESSYCSVLLACESL